MEPYRPLFVIVDDPERRQPQELRGLAVLLVVLGALRVVPALVCDELVTTEALSALVMVALGIGILVRGLPGWYRLRGNRGGRP